VSLLTRFRQHLDRAGLLRGPGTAVLAVSGGADSVALLDLVAAVASERDLALVVAHADHGMRSDSRTVGQAVRSLASRYGLPFELGELGLGPQATETAARRARYAWLRDVRARQSARWLVTAHHRDDQVETVLLRVLRGSGPAGLAAMAARGPGGIVRPLLPFTRAELAAHVAACGLPWHDDPANRDPRHLRSWVRTELLPLITARLGERVADDLLRLRRHAARQRRAWDAVVELLPELELRSGANAFDVARGTLARYDDAVAVEVVRALARRAGLPLGAERARAVVALASGPSGRRVELGRGWCAEAALDRLRVTSGAAPDAPLPQQSSAAQGRLTFGAFAVTWRPDPAPATLPRGGWITWLAPGAWEVRAAAAGDRVTPLGGVGRRAVRRLFAEARVPRHERGTWPVLARGATILWVPGICRSAADVPPPGTEAVRVDVIRSGGA
jgi:tRNA(Ile)-lysidine synthase